jgi:biopolymer transport protein ExbB/TolQ
MRTVKALLLVLVIAADMVVTACFIVSRLFGPGEYLYEMIFHRSFVQYVTLFTFALILTLLGGRFIRCFRSKREMRRLADRADENDVLDSPIGEIASKIKDTLARHGSDAALAEAEQSADRQKGQTEHAYETINFLMYLLPALGLFGTMLGLSGAMSAAFSKGIMSKESIGIFVSSLGTALDTTVLAMVCAMIAGATMWLLTRTEKPLQEQQVELVRRLSGLERLHRSAGAAQPSAGRGRDAGAATMSRAEMQASVADSVGHLTSKLEACVGRIEELTHATRACSAELASHKTQGVHGEDMVNAVTTCLDAATERIGELISAGNAEVVRTIASSLDRFAEALEASNVVTTVRAEVRTAMAENMTQTATRLDEGLKTLAEAARTSMERCTQVTSEDGQGLSRADLAEMMSTCLESAVDRLGALVASQSRETADTLAATLERFTANVDERIPRELVISYSRNARGDGELSHVA